MIRRSVETSLFVWGLLTIIKMSTVIRFKVKVQIEFTQQVVSSDRAGSLANHACYIHLLPWQQPPSTHTHTHSVTHPTNTELPPLHPTWRLTPCRCAPPQCTCSCTYLPSSCSWWLCIWMCAASCRSPIGRSAWRFRAGRRLFGTLTVVDGYLMKALSEHFEDAWRAPKMPQIFSSSCWNVLFFYTPKIC